MKYIVCRICSENKPAEDYRFINGYSRNAFYHLTICKVCQNKKKRGKRQDMYRWADSIKEELGCKECSNDNPVVLEFDHVDPNDKKMGISNMIADCYSRNVIRLEMMKCQIMCANCHRIRTIEQRRNHEIR